MSTYLLDDEDNCVVAYLEHTHIHVKLSLVPFQRKKIVNNR